jgi:hypothetical protein
MKLNEILDSNDIDLVLVDASIKGSHDFAWDIYESINYSHLDADKLEKEVELMQEIKRVLENPKTRTISGITEELKGFEKIINNKIKYFSSHYIPKNKKTKARIKRRNTKSQEQLILLQNKLYNIRRLSYAKELKIEDNNYKLLLNMIKLIEPIIKIKKDMSFVLGFHDEDKSRASDTDERLTAALYWLSLFSDKSNCLITKDQDLPRLSGIVTSLIGSESFLPYNEFFRKRIIENPFRIYKRTNEEVNEEVNKDFKLSIDNSFINYDKEFLIERAPAQINISTKYSITKMWREFNPLNVPRKQIYEYKTA